MQVTARPHPGGRLETGEFLASVEYKVTATLPDGRVIRFEGGWDIDLPPAGTPHRREILGDPDAHKVLSGAKEDLAALAQARQAAGIDREPRF